MIQIVESPPIIPGRSQIEALSEQVSASRLGMWLSCRLRFYFKYVAQIAKPSTPPLIVGKVVHSVLQEWNWRRWKGEGDFQLDQVLAQKWSEEINDQAIDWRDKEPYREKYTAYKLLEVYFRETPIPPDEKPKAVEIPLEMARSHAGDLKLIGIVDLVRSNGKIVDFKTSIQAPKPEKAAHIHEMQLTFYGLLYRDATEQVESGFELHHLVKTKQPKLVVTELPPVTDRQKSKLYRQIDSYLEGVRNEDFVPSPGLQCVSCQYFNECRRWS